MNKQVGSSFDDFLKEEGILKECEAIACKREFLFQLEKEFTKQHITRSELVDLMGSREAVSRLLDPQQPSNLSTFHKAARVTGKRLRFKFD